MAPFFFFFLIIKVVGKFALNKVSGWCALNTTSLAKHHLVVEILNFSLNFCGIFFVKVKINFED